MESKRIPRPGPEIKSIKEKFEILTTISNIIFTCQTIYFNLNDTFVRTSWDEEGKNPCHNPPHYCEEENRDEAGPHFIPEIIPVYTFIQHGD